MPATAILDHAFELAAARRSVGPPFVALAGAQGSGKTTLARAWVHSHPDVALLSLDDFYLGKADRISLAARVHPMFRTRGVPGTHDLRLLGEILKALATAGPSSTTPIPVFDKLCDDRCPVERWPAFHGRPRAILIEGWCLGALPQPAMALVEPVNALEREWDRDGRWRHYVNARLRDAYAALFARFDAIAWLHAPGFADVLRWRCEQQETLLGRSLTPSEIRDVAGFVGYFERITRHMLAGGIRADVVAELDSDRTMVSLRDANPGTSRG